MVLVPYQDVHIYLASHLFVSCVHTRLLLLFNVQVPNEVLRLHMAGWMDALSSPSSPALLQPPSLAASHSRPLQPPSVPKPTATASYSTTSGLISIGEVMTEASEYVEGADQLGLKLGVLRYAFQAALGHDRYDVHALSAVITRNFKFLGRTIASPQAGGAMVNFPGCCAP